MTLAKLVAKVGRNTTNYFVPKMMTMVMTNVMTMKMDL